MEQFWNRPANPTIPADVARERDALGAALLSQTHARDLVRLGHAEDFVLDSHRSIFAAMTELVRAGNGELDYLMVGAELQRRGKLGEIGGYAYLCNLPNMVVLAVPQQARFRRLRELSQRRRLLRIALELSRRAQNPMEDIYLAIKWLADVMEASIGQ